MTRCSRTLAATALALAATLFNTAPVRAQGFAIGAQVGTTGAGGGVILGLTPKLNLRAMFGVVPGDPSIDIDGVTFGLDLPSFLLTTVDLYALGGLHFSAGGLLITNDGDLNVVGTFDGVPVDFAGTNYTGGATDELQGTFSLKSFQPYVGIGIGNPIGKKIGIQFDAGIGIGTAPTVELTATGPLADDLVTGPVFRADVEAQEDELDIPDLLRYYPVLSLSISISL
jgi:hypothetical protein